MPVLVKITALYDGDADEIFRGATEFSEMQDAMSGFAVYEGLPDEAAAEGETYTVDVTIWGVIKNPQHVMHVEKLDFENRVLQSREHDKMISRWDHNLSVQPVEGGRARWVDAVVIDAGWRTGFVARFAAYVYRRRHKHRKALSISTEFVRQR